MINEGFSKPATSRKVENIEEALQHLINSSNMFETLLSFAHGKYSIFDSEHRCSLLLICEVMCLQANKSSIIQGPQKKYPPVSGEAAMLMVFQSACVGRSSGAE